MGYGVSRLTTRYTVVQDALTPDTRDLRPDPGVDRTIRDPVHRRSHTLARSQSPFVLHGPVVAGMI